MNDTEILDWLNKQIKHDGDYWSRLDYAFNSKYNLRQAIEAEQVIVKPVESPIVKPNFPIDGPRILVVESEKTFGESQPGPVNFSFPIQIPLYTSFNLVQSGGSFVISSSPCQYDKYENGTTSLKVDHVNHPHPNGKGFYTYFGSLNHLDYGGEKMPHPLETVMEFNYHYTDWCPEGAARMIIVGQFYWFEKGVGVSHLAELHLTSDNWGDTDPSPKVTADWDNISATDAKMEYTQLVANEWSPTLMRGKDDDCRIDWLDVIDDLWRDGRWNRPDDERVMSCQALGLAVEVKDSAVANLYFANLRWGSV